MKTEKINQWQEMLQFILHPRQTMTAVLQNQSYGWFLPLILTTVLLLFFSVIQHNMINKQSQNLSDMYLDPMMMSSDEIMFEPMGMDVKSGNVIYLDEEMPNDLPGQQSGESTLAFILKLISRLTGFWLVWLLFATMLHLGLMISGGNLEQKAIFRLTAWTTLIFAIRTIIQILFMLISGHPILGDGLSGMLPEVDGQMTFMAFILAGVDIYFFIQLGLLFLAFYHNTNISSRKIVTTLLVSALIILGLSAIPSFILEKALTALSSNAGIL